MSVTVRQPLAAALLAALAAVCAWLLLPSSALAGAPACGETITEDMTLDADLTCDGGTALVIGADGITLDLAGHTVSSACDAADCSDSIGIDNRGGYDGLRVNDGGVNAVGTAVAIAGATRNRLDGLTIEGGGYQRSYSHAISLVDTSESQIVHTATNGGDPSILLHRSTENRIIDNRIEGGIAIRAGDAIHLEAHSNDNEVRNNTWGTSSFTALLIERSRRNAVAGNVDDGFVGAVVLDHANANVLVHNDVSGGQYAAFELGDSDRNRIRHNRAENGLEIDGDGNRIKYNRVTPPAFASSSLHVSAGDANLLRGNRVAGSSTAAVWVEVEATETSVIENVAYNGGVGIRVDAPGTLIAHNLAYDNGELGIDAVDGVIDGGGNRAHGNGDERQCVGVVCKS